MKSGGSVELALFQAAAQLGAIRDEFESQPRTHQTSCSGGQSSLGVREGGDSRGERWQFRPEGLGRWGVVSALN